MKGINSKGTPTAADYDNNNTGAIVGGVVGGICGLVLLILIILLLLRCSIRNRGKSNKPSKNYVWTNICTC